MKSAATSSPGERIAPRRIAAARSRSTARRHRTPGIPTAQAATIGCLIRSGADPNATDKNGVPPLHLAVRTRCAAAVQALLDGGARVRSKNKSGSTPLHLAVQNTGRGGSGTPHAIEQQREIIALLLRSGARPGDRDGQGKAVLDVKMPEWMRAMLQSGAAGS